MEFNFEWGQHRGNFILSRNEITESFYDFPITGISFVGKKHKYKRVKEVLFEISYFRIKNSYAFYIYEWDETIDESMRIKFRDEVFPKMVDFLKNPGTFEYFTVKYINGEFAIRIHNI